MSHYFKVFLIRMVAFFVYLFGGSAIFMLIEKGEDVNNTTTTMQEIRKNMTDSYNLTEQEFDSLVATVAKIASEKPKQAWSYKDCYVYGMHLLTTIGYGSITPVTQLGQIMTVIYGVFGIPLTLLAMRAMAFQFNEQIESVLVGIEIKCLKRNQVKDKELKIVFFNIFLTLLYMFLSALMTSTSDENYSYPQAVYVWFITMTTVGFGDFVPRESNPYTILVGLCFMSGTIDAMVTYYESEQGEKSIARLTDNCLCCRRCEPSVQVDVNDDQIEFSETKDVATQTSEIMNFGVQNSAF